MFSYCLVLFILYIVEESNVIFHASVMVILVLIKLTQVYGENVKRTA